MKNLFLLLHVLLGAICPAMAQTPAAVGADGLPKAPEPVDSILRLQLFLDSKLFCPGKVDGRPGEFTTKALKRYQTANGLPETEMEVPKLSLRHL